MSRKAEITKDVLCILGAIGLVAIAVAAPNAVRLLSHHNSFKRFDKKKLSKSVNYLRQRDYVTIYQEDGKTVIKLTKNGEDKLLKYKLDLLSVPKPKGWDKKWWMVIFDIPESHKSNRRVFVDKLKEMGFAMMQKSVWVYPYRCEDEIDFLKEIYEIRKFVRVVKADYVDIEQDLKEKFAL
ncbi:MAG TPA: hypothetical protein VD770_01890 [Coxiellaceae bacterium]|nr:hypothetical protein [Coxiellaceae bacterium]